MATRNGGRRKQRGFCTASHKLRDTAPYMDKDVRYIYMWHTSVQRDLASWSGHAHQQYTGNKKWITHKTTQDMQSATEGVLAAHLLGRGGGRGRETEETGGCGPLVHSHSHHIRELGHALLQLTAGEYSNNANQTCRLCDQYTLVITCMTM